MDLRELLKDNRVVEFDFLNHRKEFRMGVVKYNNDRIVTNSGWHNIADIDQDLVDVFGAITKIYENTPDGLKLIWNRDTFVDWSKVEKDTKVQVLIDGEWVNRYFYKVDTVFFKNFNKVGESNFKEMAAVYKDGKSSFTCGDIIVYDTFGFDEIRLYKEK